jgi:hypothetical protein
MLRLSSSLGRCTLRNGHSDVIKVAFSLLASGSIIPSSQSQLQQKPQARCKHSERQIKRFQNHPARIRVEKRTGIDRTPPPMGPPNYQAIWEPSFLPNGWSAPPPATLPVPTYPFQVTRTKNKPHDAIGFLPVYADVRYVPFVFLPVKK